MKTVLLAMLLAQGGGLPPSPPMVLPERVCVCMCVCTRAQVCSMSPLTLWSLGLFVISEPLICPLWVLAHQGVLTTRVC